MQNLYIRAWERLREERHHLSDIDREATPVLFFGRWDAARVATAGLNPSEDEFRAKTSTDAHKAPLRGAQQRFLHWDDGELTPARLEEALRRACGYFELGNAYSRWFGQYSEFLESLGAPFSTGTACHTDYVSPFATKTGLSKCSGTTRVKLQEFGEPAWVEVLTKCTHVEVLFGHGRGWRRAPDLLRFNGDWATIATPFDEKGGRRCAGQPHLLYGEGRLGAGGRRLLVYWWKPNRDGSPLCFLGGEEKRQLGAIIKDHGNKRGALK